MELPLSKYNTLDERSDTHLSLLQFLSCHESNEFSPSTEYWLDLLPARLLVLTIREIRYNIKVYMEFYSHHTVIVYTAVTWIHCKENHCTPLYYICT